MKRLCVRSFAIRNAFRRKNLAIVTVAVIAMGIGLFSALAPILENMINLSEKYLKSIGDIIVYQTETNMYTSQVNMSILEGIKGIHGVRSADPQIAIMLMQSNLLDRSVDIMPYSTLFGLDAESNINHSGVLSDLIGGRPFSKGMEEVIVGSRLADIDGFEIGGSIMIHGRPFEIVGIYSTGTVINDANLLIDMDLAREMTMFPKVAFGNCSFISIKMMDPKYTDGVSARIEERFNLSTSFPRDSLKGSLDTIKMIRSATATVAMVVLLSSFVITSAVLFINVKERLSEFAMFKAMGWSNRDVMECVLVETLVLALFGGLLGIALGTLLTIYLQTFTLSMPLLLQSWRTLISSMAITVLLAIISGSYPAYKASRTRPAIVMRG